MSSMQIKNVFTGTVSEVNPDKFLSIDDLKSWVLENHGVKREHQLLLTGNSVQVKIETIADGQRIYLYDKSLISDSSPPTTVKLKEKPVFEQIPQIDNTLSSVVDAAPLFVARSKWAVNMLTQAEQYNQEIGQTIDEIAVIKSGINVAVSNLHNHSTQLEKSFYHKEDFYHGFETNFIKTAEWESSYERLSSIKVAARKDEEHSTATTTTLADWIDRTEVSKSFNDCIAKREEAKTMLDRLSGEVIAVVNQGHSLENKVKTWVGKDETTSSSGDTESDHHEIMQDVKAVVLRIQRDSEHVTSLEETGANVQTCNRLAGLHKQEFLLQIKASVGDLLDRLNQWLDKKREAQGLCIEYLRQVSQIQYKTSLIRPQLNKLGHCLENVEDLRVKVAKAVDLPFLYGMYLIEQVRRNRWIQHMKTMVSGTAETIATRRSSELKQRKSWQRHYGSTFDEVRKRTTEAQSEETQVPDAEITFSAPESEIVQSDVEGYLEQLLAADLLEPHDVLKQEYEEMVKRVPGVGDSTAVNGLNGTSVSNGVTSSGSAATSNNNNSTQQVDANEAKIRSYVSRIKKLEDLLYREQYNRRSSGDWSSNGTPIPPSNLSYIANGIAPLSPPPNSSSGGGGFAATPQQHLLQQQQTQQNQQLLSKIKQLEEQHHKDVEKMDQMDSTRKELATKLERVTHERDAAETVKKDLLDNLTNLESDFSRERRQLNQEISELKLRIEELEEDVERESDKAGELEAKQEHERARLLKQLEMVQVRERENNKNYTQELDKFIAKEHTLTEENERLKEQNDRYYIKTKDLSQRLYTGYRRSCDLLECMGLQAQKEIDTINNQVSSFNIKRVRGISKRAKAGSSNTKVLYDSMTPVAVNNGCDSATEYSTGGGGGGSGGAGSSSNNLDSTEDEVPTEAPHAGTSVLYWMAPNHGGEEEEESEDERYRKFTNEVYIDYDMFRDAVVKRFGDVEKLARKSQKYSDRARKVEQESRDKISVKSFKAGELALFLPTRDQSKAPNNPWAAFNIGAPHYFLKQSENHRLGSREWLVARIVSVEERTVNRAVDGPQDNPFDLSDGLKWHLLEAVEE